MLHRHSDFSRLAERGFHAPEAMGWLATDEKTGRRLALDAQPTLFTTPSSGIPAFLTTYIDPNIIEIAFTKNKAEEIFGPARQLGSWVDATAMFPMVERTGEVSTYGDWNNNGLAGANVNFPQRQNYLYQVIAQWGELQMERMARAKIDWASQLSEASVLVLNKFMNLMFFFGLNGLQNYGMLNDPSLGAAIQPGPKAYGAQAHGPWITAGVVTATPNEIFTDIQSLVIQLITQSNGLIDVDSALVLALPPALEGAITASNSFGVNVRDLLVKSFPNLRIVNAPQYTTASGNVAQLICTSVDGQDTAFVAYSERLRLHPVVRDLSAFKQKRTQGAWGAVIRLPFAIDSMIGL